MNLYIFIYTILANRHSDIGELKREFTKGELQLSAGSRHQ